MRHGRAATWVVIGLLSLGACTSEPSPIHAERSTVEETPGTTTTPGSTEAPPQPIVSTTPGPTPSIPEPSPARTVWKYPPLQLAAASFGGRVYAGPYVTASSPCWHLEAEARRYTVEVVGLFSPVFDGGCPAVISYEWEPVLVRPGRTPLTVHYRGDTGVSELTWRSGRLVARHVAGHDLVPAIPGDPGWWDPPLDFLVARATARDGEEGYRRERARDLCADVAERLEREGAEPFEPGGGYPLPRTDDLEWAPRPPYDAQRFGPDAYLNAEWDGWDKAYCQRLFRSDLGAEELERIAEDEVEGRQCVSIGLRRSFDGGFVAGATSDCEEPNRTPGPVPLP